MRTLCNVKVTTTFAGIVFVVVITMLKIFVILIVQQLPLAHPCQLASNVADIAF